MRVWEIKSMVYPAIWHEFAPTVLSRGSRAGQILLPLTRTPHLSGKKRNSAYSLGLVTYALWTSRQEKSRPASSPSNHYSEDKSVAIILATPWGSQRPLKTATYKVGVTDGLEKAVQVPSGRVGPALEDVCAD